MPSRAWQVQHGLLKALTSPLAEQQTGPQQPAPGVTFMLSLKPQLDSFHPSLSGGSGSAAALYIGVTTPGQKHVVHKAAPCPCCQLHLRRGPGHQARLFVSLHSPQQQGWDSPG